MPQADFVFDNTDVTNKPSIIHILGSRGAHLMLLLPKSSDYSRLFAAAFLTATTGQCLHAVTVNRSEAARLLCTFRSNSRATIMTRVAMLKMREKDNTCILADDETALWARNNLAKVVLANDFCTTGPLVGVDINGLRRTRLLGEKLD